MNTIKNSKEKLKKTSKKDLMAAEEIKNNASVLFSQKQDAKSILLVDAIGNIQEPT